MVGSIQQPTAGQVFYSAVYTSSYAQLLVVETGRPNAYGIAEIDTYVREYARLGSSRYDGPNMTAVHLR